MKIAVRIDDITSDMDWNSFLAMKKILDELNIKPLIGVIPDNRDPLLQCGEAKQDFWNTIRELQKQGWSIAMHGYQHEYITKQGGLFPLNHFSEFAGLSLEEQIAKIQKGREIFIKHNILTEIFMAPGHSYDNNTIHALRENGFQYITDGYGFRPYQYLGITFLPIAFHSRKSIVKTQKEMTTLVYHINGWSEKRMQETKKLLSDTSLQFVSYTEILKMKPVKQTAVRQFMQYAQAAGKHYLMALRSLKKSAYKHKK